MDPPIRDRNVGVTLHQLSVDKLKIYLSGKFIHDETVKLNGIINSKQCVYILTRFSCRTSFGDLPWPLQSDTSPTELDACTVDK